MSTSSRSLRSGRARAACRSMALLIVLSVLALVSVLVLAFFSQANLNRQTSFASVGQARAENVAETAIQTIVGDLRDEMGAGSTNIPGSSGNPLYGPTTNVNMLPQRLGGTAFMSLVKESMGGSNAWSGPRFAFDGPVRAMSRNNTTNASANGRYFPTARWFRPQLLTATETDLFSPPDWVVVTRLGPLTNASTVSFANLTNNAAANLSYAIGRYAYTVYDIGGLLDANVAGYSSKSGLTSDDVARKGSQALVSLAGLGGLTQDQVDSFVQWRNPTAYNSYSNYVFHVAGTNGFLYPTATNQFFLTRQDLIQYATSNGMTAALPYLTSFSREKNSPSWSPATPSGSTILYAAQAENTTSTNRDLANVRATDGSLLIKSRFDLDRLAWLTYKGPSAEPPASSDSLLANPGGTASNIQKYFGLVWDSATPKMDANGNWTGQQWVYVSPDGNGGGLTPVNTIKTLKEVADKNREPDFFELLKAGILSGSLGVYAQSEADLAKTQVKDVDYHTQINQICFRTDPSSTSGAIYNQVPDYQIFNIGMNILAQYSPDGFPPTLLTGGGNSVGVKSVPYEYGHGEDGYRPSGAIPNFLSSNPLQEWTLFWLRFSVWNPHRNSQMAAAGGPTQFRIRAFKGWIYAYMFTVTTDPVDQSRLVSLGYDSINNPDPNHESSALPAYTDFRLSNTNSLSFSTNSAFIDPTPLVYDNTTTNSSIAHAYGSVGGGNAARYKDPATGKQMAGIFLSKQETPDYLLAARLHSGTKASEPWMDPSFKNNQDGTYYGLTSEYQDWQGNWRSYQTYYNLFPYRRANDDTSGGPVKEPYTNSASFAIIEAVNLDPRDRRFGLMGMKADASDPDNLTSTFRLNAGNNRQSGAPTLRGTNFFAGSTPLSGTNSFSPADFADNVKGTGGYYADMDGVVRPGDAGGRGGPPPVYLNAAAGMSRPLVLNGFFRSTADMGYTFRDTPWRSLDFATTNSADAGLLDIFGHWGGVTNDLPVVGGKVNINSAPAPVLQALLSGAALDIGNDGHTVSATLSSGDLSTLMGALRPASGDQPSFVNKADLVSFFATNMPAAHQIKAEREAPVRALADVAQVRTWNLLIDIVAQSGRYPPGATGVNQFMVEGERHYWLQIAIDRFTGEIVDQQLEPVYEQ